MCDVDLQGIPWSIPARCGAARAGERPGPGGSRGWFPGFVPQDRGADPSSGEPPGHRWPRSSGRRWARGWWLRAPRVWGDGPGRGFTVSCFPRPCRELGGAERGSGALGRRLPVLHRDSAALGHREGGRQRNTGTGGRRDRSRSWAREGDPPAPASPEAPGSEDDPCWKCSWINTVSSTLRSATPSENSHTSVCLMANPVTEGQWKPSCRDMSGFNLSPG